MGNYENDTMTSSPRLWPNEGPAAPEIPIRIVGGIQTGPRLQYWFCGEWVEIPNVPDDEG